MRTIKFNENDATLIKQIEEYKNAHGLSSFVATVRKFCRVALEMEKIRH